ncbi:M20 family metallopeptidase [Streptomyces sp. NBC_00038]|uniref:M20 metallopeptidase family protein n=1 Tax=Streptomyces sp. NBC_00038 TaxID=2903615 RepID=UPI002258ED34|nr:M20 family metallopeptidase [Streptomyces sp. NBC_00038]MCX5557089.1 M20 family metallopeptidase [Streptomyces sp. NBC_00038]
MTPSFRAAAEAIAPELTLLRHALHREPETGLQLPLTQAKVLGALAGLPLEISRGKALGSVVAVLRGGRPGPAVLLRGDMDALPLQELAEVPYRSRFDGVMHACGHDQHVAILVGAARLLCARRQELPGTVVFMFQPGEEGYDGAGLMIGEGLLEAAGSPLVGAYSVHVMSNGAQCGTFHGRVGTQTAGNAELKVTVRGKGGHGSTPHSAADPVPVAAEMVLALQNLVTRTTSVFDPVVLTVGVFAAGTKLNIIPGTAEFEATVRSTSPEAMADFLPRAVRLVRGIADGWGVAADVSAEEIYPAMIAAREAVDLGREVVTDLYGEAGWYTAEHPIMASEDFSRVTAVTPGVQLGLSACPPGTDPATAPFNHSAYAVFDDAAIPAGAAVLAEMAWRRVRA